MTLVMQFLVSLIVAFAAMTHAPEAVAREYRSPGLPNAGIVGPTGSISGRAPWNAPYEYDSGSGNDRFPERPYYQQGRGQQTGGPARNLLPDDGIRLFPH